ncbi:MAG TPA: ABC transporter substrate-binding protein [Stellaceae bacterium]|nr:ABC transporter substrate-binding protein [Stellaceae bacterium]
MTIFTRTAASAVALLALTLPLTLTATAGSAAEPIKIADVIELSGTGATTGTNWRNAAAMAIDEINAKGGILGRQVQMTDYDTQTNPGVSRAQIQKALDGEPYVILGPIFSGSVKANMNLAQQAEIPQFVGAQAEELTHLGDDYLFRANLSQGAGMAKIANYIHDDIKAKSIAVVWVNNDFGKGGHDAILKQMASAGIKIAADISTESGQADFAADVVKAKSANPDAIFVYSNEEESARFLREAKKQGVAVPLVGETTLLGQKVIDLAGDAANGARGHVSLSPDAPIPAVQAFRDNFKKRYDNLPDHAAMQAYMAVYAIKAMTEKLGKVDSKALAAAFHGGTVTPAMEPNVLMDASWDKNGDVDRDSFLAEVVDGKQKIVAVLPRLAK